MKFCCGLISLRVWCIAVSPKPLCESWKLQKPRVYAAEVHFALQTENVRAAQFCLPPLRWIYVSPVTHFVWGRTLTFNFICKPDGIMKMFPLFVFRDPINIASLCGWSIAIAISLGGWNKYFVQITTVMDVDKKWIFFLKKVRAVVVYYMCIFQPNFECCTKLWFVWKKKCPFWIYWKFT